jgi:DNA-binding NtrC family response regulator
MSESLLALLVHAKVEPFGCLARALNELSVETCSAATCQDAHVLISQRQPEIIFTESSLPDGWWSTILNMADSVDMPPRVIVVSPYPDTRLYLSVMERGAVDIIVPPFGRKLLQSIVRLATLKSCRVHQRELAHAAVI